MVDTIKDDDTLLGELTVGGFRNNTVQTIRDTIYSKGVGGTMYVNDVDIDVTTAWAPFIWFSNSIDTKGLQEDLTQGHFTVQTGAGGTFAVDVIFGVGSIFAGWIEIAVTKNGSITPYKTKRSLTAGGSGVSGIVASGDLVSTDTFGLAIRASGNATVQCESCQYRGIRIGQ